MGKTPFEIRQQLLQMAQDRLSQEYFAKLEETKSFDDPALMKQFLETHKFPGTQEVIQEAQLLNEFVSDAGK